MSSTPVLTPRHPRNEWLLLHASFVVIGIITTMLGPILPSFIHRWSLTDAQAGFFFTTQYFGSFFGVILTGVLLPRLGFSKAAAAGFVAFVLGYAFLGSGPWIVSALMVGVNGFGYGLANPAINLRATQLPSKNTAAAVTFLNFSWSIGSVLCPFIIGYVLPRFGVRDFSLSIMVACAVLVVLHLSRRVGPVGDAKARASHPLPEWLAHMRLPQAVPLLLLFLLYVGVEVAIGGWVASYEKRMPGMSTVALMLAPSVYYGLLLLGRGVSPLTLRHFSQVQISAGGLALAAIGGFLIALSNTPHLLYIGAAMAGFGLAPQYPIFVTWLAAIFRQDSPWIGSLFFAAAGIGGGAVPWLVGIVSANTGSLRAGLYIPLLITVLMIFLSLRARPSSEASAPDPDDAVSA
ncbi:MAG TPA: MFS transporter [Methylomirabilota bacterium]|nr:MFS transporter [Methylomirabilota bacterium]